jgi:SAM-dependent methyltransferase
MTAHDPIDLLFGGMAQLGPGSDADTRHALRLLPESRFDVVVDAGCGTGRQTLVLAKELGTPIHAVDRHEPFLAELRRRAGEAGVAHLVQAHCMDMADIPGVFSPIDLLWSEGAAYTIGLASALATWAPAVREGGLVVVSELCWLRKPAPDAVRQFFSKGYPAMRSVRDNLAVAASAGYRVLTTHTLPREAWTEGYYDILESRARALLQHPDRSVRELAAETVHEIEIFARAEDSYGYVFLVLQRR